MFADLGYAVAALGYFALLLLIFTGRKAGIAKYLLVAATLTTCLWAVSNIRLLGWQTHISHFFVADAVRQWVWVLFLAACLRSDFSSFKQIILRPITLSLLVLPTVAIIAGATSALPYLWQYSLHTLIALQMLIVLELVYRQAGEQKWAYKPLVLFLGALSLFDFVTYANATMINQIGENYVYARGYIFVALLPFLILAIRRISYWGVAIFVSRDVVLHSTLLLVAGGYLFLMALVGYLVKFLGGSWSYPVQFVLIGVSLILLLSVFLSHNFRTKTKVFITKHFYANQFDYRVEWVKLTEILSEQQESLNEVYQTSLSGMLQAVEYESGVLLKLNKNGWQQVAKINGGENREYDVVKMQILQSFFERKTWIIDIGELRVKPHQYEELSAKSDFMDSFDYQLIVPIFRQEKLWGMVLLDAESEHVKSLNWELRDYINAVTAQVSNYIFQFEDAQILAENAQFAAFSRMSAFVLHDLKNVMAQIDLILANAKQHKSNPEFIDDTFETLEHTKSRMDNMLKQLTEKETNQRPRQRQFQSDIGSILHSVVEQRCQGFLPLPTVECESSLLVQIDAEKFANVMYHLISNAQQATKDVGTVVINASEFNQNNQDYVVVRVIDTGEGMSAEFIETRLFKPFDTTKGNAGMGIGAYDAKNYIEEIGGIISVESEIDQGTVFTLSIPVTE
jgi:putative PEP-CTERM system histidine kinase